MKSTRDFSSIDECNFIDRTFFYRIAIITKDGIERRTHLHNELPKFENFMH